MSALRLSELGSDPESVLRLVRFFDDLDATGADAVLAASVFHYGILTIADVKAELKKHGYTVR